MRYDGESVGCGHPALLLAVCRQRGAAPTYKETLQTSGGSRDRSPISGVGAWGSPVHCLALAP